MYVGKNLHANCIDRIRNGFDRSIAAVYLGCERQLPTGVILTGTVLHSVRRLPCQRAALFFLLQHLKLANASYGYSSEA